MSGKDSSFSENQEAGSSVSACPLKNKKEEPCDPDGLKVIFSTADGTQHAECDVPRSERDIKAYLGKLPVEESQKFLLVNDYDVILETVTSPTSQSSKNPGRVYAEPTFGEGPCGDHGGLDFSPKNTDPHDQLVQKATDVQNNGGYEMWAKSSLADTDLSHTMGIIGLFRMFDDTSEKDFIKEVVVNYDGCGLRHDGKKPNEAFLGLVRIYRNDEYSLKLSIPSRRKKGVGGSTSKDFSGKKSSESRSQSGNSETTKSFKEGKLDDEKTKQVGYLTNSETTSGDSSNEQSPNWAKKAPSLNEKGLTLSRSGHELDFTKKFNDLIAVVDMVYNGIDFLKEIKDSIPKAGISGDISIEFLSGSLEAKWGYGSCKWDTKEYVWVAPKFSGTAELTIFKISGSVKVGIETVSPSVLNWWGKKAWEFELSLTIGFDSSLMVSTTIEYPSESAFPRQDILPGCEYTGKDGKEQKVANVGATVNPIFKGVAKVNLLGIGAEASIELSGAIKVDATVCWPFDVRYKGIREKGELYVRYSVGAKEPSPPMKIDCWDGDDDFIEDNYVLGPKKK
ncbi:MAG: hypothetical protein ACSHYA_15355 [Opitutaceae bacterium]